MTNVGVIFLLTFDAT